MRVTKVARLVWYSRRLAAMSLPEILHRVREQFRRVPWRYKQAGWARFDIGDGALLPLPALVLAFQQPWPDELDDLIRGAVHDIKNGNIRLLGQVWPRFNPDVRIGKGWFLDPVSEHYWPGPETYCFDIDVRHRTSMGDVKYVWEFNRLQFLHPVAALAAHDKDPALTRWAINVLLDWMDANPPFRGVNWPSGIELALRLISLAVVVAGKGDDEIEPSARKRLRSFVAAHAYWLARNPSLYSSANNHHVAEGLGLIVAALVCPDLPHADKYLAEGTAILDSAVNTQFFSDGVGVEQTPTYASFTLEMIALGTLLLEEAGYRLKAEHSRILENAARHLKLLLDSRGVPPRIGDDDEGRVLSISPVWEERYVASIVAALAGLLDIPALSPPVRDAHWRDLVFRSPSSGPEPADGMNVFSEGGYTIVHEGIGGRRLLLAFDHGPLGFQSIAAHGHADALAIWLHIDGIPIFVDAGTYLYHSGGAWREHFRSTTAHNTVEIAGESSSVSGGAFNWRHKASAKLYGIQTGPRWSVTARHDGYMQRFGVEHERTVARTSDGIVVSDRILGKIEKGQARIAFLINPSLVVQRTPFGVMISDEFHELLRMTIPEGCDIELVAGENGRRPSVYSSAFGSRVEATTILIAPQSYDGSIDTIIQIAPKQATALRSSRSG